MELIELQRISKYYQTGDIQTPVLDEITLKIGRGEFVALMGPSGSGKTTLMNLLGCLDSPTGGHYWLDSEDVGAMNLEARARLRSMKIGFIFQNFNLLARTTALDNLLMPLTYSTEKISAAEAWKRAVSLLERVGLANRMDHEPSRLSGGQQQRVAIARSLMNRPPLIFADEPTGNLDSRTSEEVLALLETLNREEGVTIILVTHDENVARHARRIIRIRDGRVEADEVRLPPADFEQAPTIPSSPVGILSQLSETLSTSLTGLRRNTLRAALTALGIIIGIASVIAMMEIGNGSAKSIQRTVASMGANNLTVFPGSAASGGVSFGSGSVMTLTPEDVIAVSNECPAVRAAAPIVRSRTQVVFGNKNWVPSSIFGTTPAFLEIRDWSMSQGEMFTDRDVRNANKVCVLGQRIVKELFGEQNPIGKEIRINNVPFQVRGILSRKGANMMGMDQDDIVLAPWTAIKFRVSASALSNANQSAAAASNSNVNTLNKVYPGSTSLYPGRSESQVANNPLPVRFVNIDQILAVSTSAEAMPQAIAQITSVLRERHRLQPGEPDDFSIRDMTEVSKALSSTTTMMTNLLLVVALISLVVGGVGIMNIMLVSVTERTREIGLRMAVGASPARILQQFLTEAILLCFFGGAVGILIGRLTAILVSWLLRWPTEVSITAIVAAFAVSATVGILFGYYPAWKASRLDPISALRYE
ncbi:MAG: ABC transporter permease [Leptospirales bacterium]|nr:ABC transporter permease [Leptospirales bacterium]